MQKKRLARLTWQSRRGMLELDLLLLPFAQQHLKDLTEVELNAYEKLLSQSDPDLYTWLMGSASPCDKELLHIVALIQSHHHTKKI